MTTSTNVTATTQENAETPHEAPREPNSNRFTDTVAFRVALGVTSVAFLILPIFLVVQTVNKNPPIAVTYVSSENMEPIVGIALIALMLVLFRTLYKRTVTHRTLIFSLLMAIVFSIYLGYAIWLIVNGWIEDPAATANPYTFGRMIWWNLLDSIPLIDLDAALDWERPMEEYGSRIGFLFLTQKAFILFTVIRALYLLLPANPLRTR